MSRPRWLDLFCCEGGASTGYARAGFDVYGVDLFRHRDDKGRWVGPTQQRYPFPSYQGDALVVLAVLLIGEGVPFTHPDGRVEVLTLADFVGASASPPCQPYSITKHTHDVQHPELVEPTRDALVVTGLPYVIENVPGAPLREPLVLCGSEFGLRALDPHRGRVVTLRRHRLFESNVLLMGAGGCSCKVDRAAGRIAGVYGAGARSVEAAKIRRGGYTPARDTAALLMGCDWMTMEGLQQAIPPAYTEHLGLQVLAHLTERALA